MEKALKAWLRTFFILSIPLAALVGVSTSAVELEYITPERSRSFEEQFSAAGAVGKSSALTQKLMDQKIWSCSMYGMRTHLQVEKSVKLYNFNAKTADGWKNKGAQPIETYRMASNEIIGKNDRLQDQVRLDDKGHLISKLSSIGSTTPTVIAYSVCDAVP